MLEIHRNWKLTATLPNSQAGKRHFDLQINGKSFYEHDFVPQAKTDFKSLRGIITLNESLFLDKDYEFEWNSKTARNRLKELLFYGQKI